MAAFVGRLKYLIHCRKAWNKVRFLMIKHFIGADLICHYYAHGNINSFPQGGKHQLCKKLHFTVIIIIVIIINNWTHNCTSLVAIDQCGCLELPVKIMLLLLVVLVLVLLVLLLLLLLLQPPPPSPPPSTSTSISISIILI